MRAVIISGGTISDYQYTKSLIKPEDVIICVDGGYNHALCMGLVPGVLIGDLDSIGEKPLNVPIIQYPTSKDFTDTEIALNYAKDKGYEDILLLGGLGTRLDHTLANILLLINFRNTTIVNEYNKIRIGSEIELEEAEGTFVSLIPLGVCSGIYTQNLKYPLENATMEAGYGIGISNVMTASKAKVTVAKGDMLVVVAKD
ncbi:MAG: thiamine diphosphokinase [Defluviitaleaceae bacterium]|nr:thiamine diphosphokinase [Defluviitaleaceae bacterium]